MLQTLNCKTSIHISSLLLSCLMHITGLMWSFTSFVSVHRLKLLSRNNSIFWHAVICIILIWNETTKKHSLSAVLPCVFTYVRCHGSSFYQNKEQDREKERESASVCFMVLFFHLIGQSRTNDYKALTSWDHLPWWIKVHLHCLVVAMSFEEKLRGIQLVPWAVTRAECPHCLS